MSQRADVGNGRQCERVGIAALALARCNAPGGVFGSAFCCCDRVMSQQTGNLDSNERAVSALLGVSLAILAMRRGDPLWRVLTGVASAALLARSCVGLAGYQTRPWERVELDPVDQSVDDSFPASDPPASHVPDEPPANAQAKWDAAKAAGKA
jgi:hypothetical protein